MKTKEGTEKEKKREDKGQLEPICVHAKERIFTLQFKMKISVVV